MAALSDIIGLWPSIDAFAEDAGVAVSLARVWKSRRSIPAERWSKIEEAAAKRGIDGATASHLAKIAAVSVSI